MFPLRRPLVCSLATLLCAGSALAVEDSPAVDLKNMLQSLQTMKETQATQSRATKSRAAQEAQAAAQNPARAVELWEEAVRATQFHGASKEGAQFREWKEGEGDALREPQVQSALRLYFNWLSLTLQRAGGAQPKDLLPAVQAYLRDAIADQAAMESLEETMKNETPAAGAGPRRPGNQRDREKRASLSGIKKMHDQILNRPLAGSVYVEWLRLDEVIGEVAAGRRGGGKGGAGGGGGGGDKTWEGTPGNVDGIFNMIVQPLLRENRDPRVVEYWDYLLRHEADAATRSKLAFEIEKFNQVRRPTLLWNRTRELNLIGLKNRAATDMFELIKKNPNHPELKGWITELEGILSPSASTAPAAPTP